MTDPSRGLDASEVLARRAPCGANALPEAKGSGVFAQAWRQLATEPMFLLVRGAAALYLALGNRAEGLLLAGVLGTVGWDPAKRWPAIARLFGVRAVLPAPR